MSDKTMKPGWRRVKFGDVVRQFKDKVDPKNSGLKRYIAGEHMDTDDLRIHRWGEISNDYLGPAFHMRFKPGQVLYGSRRTYLRKVAVPNFEGICANTTFVLESKNPDVLLQELLPFIMQTDVFHEHSIKQSKGSVNPYINFSDIEWYEFALPPLEEQKRLTNTLLELDNLISQYKILLEKIVTLRWSYFNKYFLQENSRIIINEEKCFPEGWTVRPITECFIVVKEKKKPNEHDKYFIGLEHISSGTFSTSQYGNPRSIVGLSTIFRPGDLLYGKLRPNLDKAIISSVHGICSTEIMVLRAVPSITSNKFLAHHFHSSRFIAHNAHQAYGTKMPRTSLEIMSKVRIPIPPLSEQNEMLDNLQIFQERETAIRNRITDTKRKIGTVLTNRQLNP